MPERKYRWLHLAGPLLVAASLARAAAPVATMTEILAAALAPHTAANIEALARAHYFDGLAILRLLDN